MTTFLSLLRESLADLCMGGTLPLIGALAGLVALVTLPLLWVARSLGVL